MASEHHYDLPEAQIILANMKALRQHIIDAWQARGVVLTVEEQRELRAEIKQTCELLTALTASSAFDE